MSSAKRHLNRVKYGTRQVNNTGEFNNLYSSGTFKLPSDTNLDTSASTGPAITVSGPDGAIQLSDGAGNLRNNADIYIEEDTSGPYPFNRLVLDSESSATGIPTTGLLFKKPLVIPIQAFQGEEGSIVYGDPQGSGVDSYGWKGPGGPWISLTNTGGGANAAGGNTEIQFNANGNFAASPNFTFNEVLTPNVFTATANTNLSSGNNVVEITNNTGITVTAGGTGSVNLVGTNTSTVAITTATGNITAETANGSIVLTAVGGAPQPSTSVKLVSGTAVADLVSNSSNLDSYLQLSTSQPGTAPLSGIWIAGGSIATVGAAPLSGATSNSMAQLYLQGRTPLGGNRARATFALNQLQNNNTGGFYPIGTMNRVFVQTQEVANVQTSGGGDGQGGYRALFAGGYALNVGGNVTTQIPLIDDLGADGSNVPLKYNEFYIGAARSLTSSGSGGNHININYDTSAGPPVTGFNVANTILAITNELEDQRYVTLDRDGRGVAPSPAGTGGFGTIRLGEFVPNAVLDKIEITGQGELTAGINPLPSGSNGRIRARLNNDATEQVELVGEGSTSNHYGLDGVGNSIVTVLNQGRAPLTLGFAAGSNVGIQGAGSGITTVLRGGMCVLGNKFYGSNTPSANEAFYTDFPQPDSNLVLGSYGWGTDAGIQATYPSVNTSWKCVNSSGTSGDPTNNAVGFGGSGNVYCDQVRQNLYYWMPTQDVAPGTPTNPGNRSWGGPGAFGMGFNGSPPLLYPQIGGTPNHSYGYLCNQAGGKGWYNNGNIRNLVVDVGGYVDAQDTIPAGLGQDGAGVTGFNATVTLPKINEAMVGMRVTISRARIPPFNPNGGIPTSPGKYTTKGINLQQTEYHKIAVVIQADNSGGAFGNDMINAPDSITVFNANGRPGVALDPYRVLVPFPYGESGGGQTSGFTGNRLFNTWTAVLVTPQALVLDEFPRQAAPNGVSSCSPGVSIFQLNPAPNPGNNPIFYGKLVDVKTTVVTSTRVGNGGAIPSGQIWESGGTAVPNSEVRVTELIFTAAADGNTGGAGVYNFSAGADLYIGGYYNSAIPGFSAGSQTIAANNISQMTFVNQGTGTGSAAARGFPQPYTSISSATFVAAAIGNGMKEASGAVPEKYVWHYMNEFPQY